MTELDHPPLTDAVRQALRDVSNPNQRDDLLFLERWELCPEPGLAATRRAAQLRRANPGLAAAIRAEGARV
jgi:hypothetical protein